MMWIVWQLCDVHPVPLSSILKRPAARKAATRTLPKPAFLEG